MSHVVFLLLGLANGAVFASLAAAVVVTYRSSGVVNFATGSLALIGAYSYAYMREGKYLILLPGLPVTADLGGKLNFAFAAAFSIAQTAILGLVLYLLIFRPLRNATAVARSVASLGVTVTIVGLIAQRVGVSPIVIGSIFPQNVWKIGSTSFPSDRIWFALTVLIVAVLLTGLYRFTGFGLATRAVADSEVGAYVSGLSPDRIAAANWMIASAVAGGAGILISPIVPLVPLSFSLFIVPALAAAAIGRFKSIIGAVIAGLAIGMIQSELTNLQELHSWLPSTGLPDVIPLVLLLGVLLLRSSLLPSRGELIAPTLGRAPRSRHPLPSAAVGLIVGGVALPLLHPEWRVALITSFIFGIIGLSFVVITGLAGQVSLAQLTLAGVGAFTLSPLTAHWHVPFPIAPLVAAAVAAFVGVIVGLPALRVRGLPVAVVTLALAVVVENGWFRNSDYVPAEGKNISGPYLFGWDLRGQVGVHFGRVQFGYLVLAVLALTAVGVAYLRSSRLGIAMLAVRADERAAAGVGINVVVVKLLAFGIAAFIAGFGGSMLGYLQGNVTGDSFGVLLGFGVFALIYVAGITSVSGGILSGILAANGIVFMLIDKHLSLGSWYDTISGIGLIFTIIKEPEGIVGPIHQWVNKRRDARQELTGAPSHTMSAADAAAPRRPRRALAKNVPSALSVESLRVNYSSVVAVNDVTIDVPKGSITGIIGPNGAGKTTLLDAICGFTDAGGTVHVGSEQVDGLPPHQRIRSGLGRTFQALNLYDDLTVAENVETGLAAHWAGRPGASMDTLVDQALAQMDIREYADRSVSELSQGQRQLVSIARALAGNPDVLLLDEPAGGLDTTESRWLGARLHALRDAGKTIVVVDHDMSLILELCDKVCVLDFGKLIAAGTAAEIQNDPRVVEAYLGASHAQEYGAPA